MKNINKILLCSLSLAIFWGCEDEDKNPFPLSALEQAAVLRTITPPDVTTINKSNPSESTITLVVEADDFQDNTRFESMDIFVSLVDTFIDVDQETSTTFDDEDASVDDMLLLNVPASSFIAGGEDGKPQYTVVVNGQDVIDLLNPDLTRVDGGDIFRIRLGMNLNDGSVFTSTNVNGNVTGQFFSSPFRYDATVVCILPPPAGEYRIDMQDSFGDGWQTTTNDGGPGITVTLSNGEIIEFGLCTPYEASPFDCTVGLEQGSTTVTLPEGLESAVWNFPGDNWGEISFQIYAPSGNLIASYEPGSPAGPIPLNLCNE
ncbi:hypothetical protein [Maribacter litoralis]|uniref:hypothetical protein n=1 Tax=Maribacter litoralis TaxID=2059726 RepID=UPI003F5CD40B